LIHTARRNIDLTVVMINNQIYGMTGGQYSPMTPYPSKASTAQYSTFEYPFDVCELVKAAGATYVARSTTYHINLTQKLIENAIRHKGFSFVEVIAQCPTNFGKRNKMGSPYDMLMKQKEMAVTVEQAETMTKEDLEGKIVIGELLHRTDRKPFDEVYHEMVQKAQATKGGKL
jgi:2-oxoglutarate ferredoxin oxidoreductase subunit beta